MTISKKNAAADAGDNRMLRPDCSGRHCVFPEEKEVNSSPIAPATPPVMILDAAVPEAETERAMDTDVPTKNPMYYPNQSSASHFWATDTLGAALPPTPQPTLPPIRGNKSQASHQFSTTSIAPSPIADTSNPTFAPAPTTLAQAPTLSANTFGPTRVPSTTVASEKPSAIPSQSNGNGGAPSPVILAPTFAPDAASIPAAKPTQNTPSSSSGEPLLPNKPSSMEELPTLQPATASASVKPSVDLSQGPTQPPPATMPTLKPTNAEAVDGQPGGERPSPETSEEIFAPTITPGEENVATTDPEQNAPSLSPEGTSSTKKPTTLSPTVISTASELTPRPSTFSVGTGPGADNNSPTSGNGSTPTTSGGGALEPTPSPGSPTIPTLNSSVNNPTISSKPASSATKTPTSSDVANLPDNNNDKPTISDLESTHPPINGESSESTPIPTFVDEGPTSHPTIMHVGIIPTKEPTTETKTTFAPTVDGSSNAAKDADGTTTGEPTLYGQPTVSVANVPSLPPNQLLMPSMVPTTLDAAGNPRPSASSETGVNPRPTSGQVGMIPCESDSNGNFGLTNATLVDTDEAINRHMVDYYYQVETAPKFEVTGHDLDSYILQGVERAITDIVVAALVPGCGVSSMTYRTATALQGGRHLQVDNQTVRHETDSIDRSEIVGVAADPPDKVADGALGVTCPFPVQDTQEFGYPTCFVVSGGLSVFAMGSNADDQSWIDRTVQAVLGGAMNAGVLDDVDPAITHIRFIPMNSTTVEEEGNGTPPSGNNAAEGNQTDESLSGGPAWSWIIAGFSIVGFCALVILYTGYRRRRNNNLRNLERSELDAGGNAISASGAFPGPPMEIVDDNSDGDHHEIYDDGNGVEDGESGLQSQGQSEPRSWSQVRTSPPFPSDEFSRRQVRGSTAAPSDEFSRERLDINSTDPNQPVVQPVLDEEHDVVDSIIGLV